MSSLSEDMLVQISGIQGTLSRVLLKDKNCLSLSAIYTTKMFTGQGILKGKGWKVVGWTHLPQ
jgi:hypothetical protein